MMKFAAVAVALAAAITPAFAQDAAVVNAKSAKVRVDKPDARVLESSLKPGEKEKLHSHPASILYIIAGGKIRNHSADGKVSEALFRTGDVIYRDPLTHWAENIGKTTIHLILVELKCGK